MMLNPLGMILLFYILRRYFCQALICLTFQTAQGNYETKQLGVRFYSIRGSFGYLGVRYRIGRMMAQNNI